MYEPIETFEKMETSIILAIRQPEANERMVEAFVLAVWSAENRNS